MRERFKLSLEANSGLFAVDLSNESVDRLADYFDLVQQHNPLLHLVAPCEPEQFATRHILESLMMLEYLPKGAIFADIGSGGGLPAIPCLLLRENLRATLIESKEKKSRFLEIAIEHLKLAKRAFVVNRQFEEADPADSRFVTCRALDRFTEKVPKILKWSKGRDLLFFGGPSLMAKLDQLNVAHSQILMPLSNQRYLFEIRL